MEEFTELVVYVPTEKYEEVKQALQVLEAQGLVIEWERRG